MYFFYKNNKKSPIFDLKRLYSPPQIFAVLQNPLKMSPIKPEKTLPSRMQPKISASKESKISDREIEVVKIEGNSPQKKKVIFGASETKVPYTTVFKVTTSSGNNGKNENHKSEDLEKQNQIKRLVFFGRNMKNRWKI